MRRVAFFLNPVLVGRGDRRATVERCAATVRSEGCRVELLETGAVDRTGGLAREAIASGFDTIFTCGGDGTLFQVLQGIAGSDATLGVIPMGTGNVLAQNLHLPRNPLAAFEKQRRVQAIPIALGEVTCGDRQGGGERSWNYLLAAGIGMHAAVMDLAPSGRGKRLWGRAAYYAGGIRLLLNHPIRPVDVELTKAGGEVERFRACEVLAARAKKIGLWRAGGELRSTRLRMTAVPQSGRAGMAHACFHAFATQKGNREGGMCFPRYEDVLEILCTPAPGLGSEEPALVEADGEVVGAGRARFRLSEKRVRLLWPGAV